MEKFSESTLLTINLLTIEFISQPEDELRYNDKESDFVPACTDELIGTHLLTPHLN